MSISRVITDVPAGDVPFIVAMIASDGGKVVDQQPESDGEFTIVAEFPDQPAAASETPVAPTATAAAARAAAPAPATGAASQSIEERWLAIARKEFGTAEGGSSGSNPRIEKYHASTHGGGAPDSVPWCSSFVNFCVTEAGVGGTNSKAARSWMTWGRDAGAFKTGCIVVLQRGAAPKGHVGFCVGMENGRVKLLGGNQGDRVGTASFDATKVLARRMAP